MPTTRTVTRPPVRWMNPPLGRERKKASHWKDMVFVVCGAYCFVCQKRKAAQPASGSHENRKRRSLWRAEHGWKTVTQQSAERGMNEEAAGNTLLQATVLTSNRFFSSVRVFVMNERIPVTADGLFNLNVMNLPCAFKNAA
eukprot:Gregarina_sp_Poly_1__2158@NODE_1572_length_3818_cov_127_782991_g1039_i0_p4_GENE_NODE_1572_length_3818_cov_127_782991_g1039_i0NODE_1572_length_3818_cov_127_782991_g1039_i0_p4_ORF_typecomplete_len141_score8_34_NODE_1572_length_3818_cov_127_782991_g1039_i037459